MIIMVYCRVSNKVRFFIYNIYAINKKKSNNNNIKTEMTPGFKPFTNLSHKNIYINKKIYRVYKYLQLCLVFKIPYIKGVSEGIVLSYVSNSYREFIKNSYCRVLNLRILLNICFIHSQAMHVKLE